MTRASRASRRSLASHNTATSSATSRDSSARSDRAASVPFASSCFKVEASVGTSSQFRGNSAPRPPPSAAAIIVSISGRAPARSTYVPGDAASSAPQRPQHLRRTEAAQLEAGSAQLPMFGSAATTARSAAMTLWTTVVACNMSPLSTTYNKTLQVCTKNTPVDRAGPASAAIPALCIAAFRLRITSSVAGGARSAKGSMFQSRCMPRRKVVPLAIAAITTSIPLSAKSCLMASGLPPSIEHTISKPDRYEKPDSRSCSRPATRRATASTANASARRDADSRPATDSNVANALR